MTLALLISVGLGGALGALVRALVGRWIQRGFPWATLVVNVSGSFILAAALTGLPAEASFLRTLIGAGFCGALTTFSTFILEVLLMFKARRPVQALAYLFATLVLCILASWSGINLIT